MSKKKMEEVKKDASELKDTIAEDPANAKNKAKYVAGKYKLYLLLGVVISVFGYFWFFQDWEYPQWLPLVVISSVATMIIMYPYAAKVVDMFIEDTRKPVLEINESEDTVENEVSLWWVPEHRINDIQMEKDTEPQPMQTDRGRGFEVLEFNREMVDGREIITARGTWEGSKSPLELKRDRGEIKSMREDLVPYARKGFKYEVKWPQIVHKVTSYVTNEIVYEFQGISNYKGKEIHQQIESIIDEERVEESESEENEDAKKMEMLAEMMEGENNE